jgi:outer membrane protein
MRMEWKGTRHFVLATMMSIASIIVSDDALAQQQQRPPDYRAAQRGEGTTGSGMHYRVGAGTGARPDYEGSNDYDVFPYGLFKVWWDDGRYAELVSAQSSGSAIRLAGNLIPNSPIEFGPVLQYRLERDNVQSGRVDQLGEVDAAVEAGVTAAYRMKPWSIESTWVYDISSKYEGHLLELAGGYEEKLSNNLGISLTAASTWASDGYMDTYFGVSAADAALIAGYTPHNPDDGFKDVGGRMALAWAGDNWGGWKLVASFSYFRLLDDAEDSPIVDESGDKNQFFGGVMGTYEH